jgi:SAM-dependent methyltransferase
VDVAARLTTYDDLPYDSVPLPEADPEYLAALARLHGLAAPEAGRARVLELGCGSGGNLLPIAWYARQSSCIGIEPSRRQAEDGQRLIDAAGVSNAQILHADFSTLNRPLGEFDFILAHGVFSWVPTPMQEALLRLCAQHLARNGIACISFNVFPGWQSRQALRGFLLRHVARINGTVDQVTAAKQALRQMAADWSGGPLREFPDLRDELQFLVDASPASLFREYLSDINEPFTIGEFLSRAQIHGLDYLADASPGLCRRPGSMRLALVEQQFDEREMTRVRRSLLVRKGAPRLSEDPDSVLDATAFHSNLQCNEEIKLDTPAAQSFHSRRGAVFGVRHPMTKAALIVLASIYPESIRFTDLVEAAQVVMQRFGVTHKRTEASAFREEWRTLTWRHAVTPNLKPQKFFCDITPSPLAHALARAQAAMGHSAIGGAHQVALELDAPARTLLSLLDGTHNRIALVAKLFARREFQGLDLTAEEVAASNDRWLQFFARHALLVA